MQIKSDTSTKKCLQSAHRKWEKFLTTIVQMDDQLVHRSSTDTRPVRQQNCPKSRQTVKKTKMCNTWLGRRGTCSRTPSIHDLTPTAMTVRETGSGEAGLRWRLKRRRRTGEVPGSDTVDTTNGIRQRRNGSGSYGRKRPRRGTVTLGDDMAKTSVRLTHSVAPTSTWRRRTWTAARQLVHRQLRSSHSSAAAHTRTAARQLARPATPTHSPTTPSTTIGLLSFTHAAQLLELNSNYTVSRLNDRLTVTNSRTFYAAVSHKLSRVNLSLSHFSTQSLNSNWFTSTRRARTRAPAWSVTCYSRAGPTRPQHETAKTKTQTVNRRFTSQKTTDRRSLYTKTVDRKSERDRPLQWGPDPRTPPGLTPLV